MKAGQHGLCLVVASDDDLDVPERAPRRRSHTKRTHIIMPLLCRSDLSSLVKGMTPKSVSTQPTGCKEEGVIKLEQQQNNIYHHLLAHCVKNVQTNS
jgi:hypothetical protein